jgi:hypothetical protein
VDNKEPTGNGDNNDDWETIVIVPDELWTEEDEKEAQERRLEEINRDIAERKKEYNREIQEREADKAELEADFWYQFNRDCLPGGAYFDFFADFTGASTVIDLGKATGVVPIPEGETKGDYWKRFAEDVSVTAISFIPVYGPVISAMAASHELAVRKGLLPEPGLKPVYEGLLPERDIPGSEEQREFEGVYPVAMIRGPGGGNTGISAGRIRDQYESLAKGFRNLWSNVTSEGQPQGEGGFWPSFAGPSLSSQGALGSTFLRGNAYGKPYGNYAGPGDGQRASRPSGPTGTGQTFGTGSIVINQTPVDEQAIMQAICNRVKDEIPAE